MTNFISELKSERILVIEDNADGRALFKRALGTEDFEVTAVGDGAEALELLKSGSFIPNLVLLDITMPKMSGEEFMAQLRSDPRFLGMKVVLVSGWDGLAKKAQDLGAVGYIQKPVDLRKLCREVRKHLGPQNAPRT